MEIHVAGVSLSVRDDGHGIKPGDRVRLFERFRRAGSNSAFPGAGLGLSIVERIIAVHGGRIEVLDPPGGGAQFVLHLRPV